MEIAKCAAYILAGVIVAICNIAAARYKKKEKPEVKPIEIPSMIKDYIVDAIEEAEQSGLKGVMKKSYAMSLIVLKCVSSGIDYNAIENLVSDYLERLVDLTKKVN